MRRLAERAVAPPSAAVAGALDYLELDPRGTAAGLACGAAVVAAAVVAKAWGAAALLAMLLAGYIGWALRGLAAGTSQSGNQTKKKEAH